MLTGNSAHGLICQYVTRTYFFTANHYYSQITLQTLCPEKTDLCSSLWHILQRSRSSKLVTLFPSTQWDSEANKDIYAQLTVSVSSYLR
jgi:hypothetical protein